MFAIISYKNNQYRVEEGKEIKIDLIPQSEAKDGKIVFSEVILVDDGKGTTVGEPTVKDASVDAEVVKEVRDDKVTTRKFHKKARYSRTIGNRQKYSLVRIAKINLK